MSIKGAVEEAKKQGKKILVDMIGVKDIEGRANKQAAAAQMQKMIKQG